MEEVPVSNRARFADLSSWSAQELALFYFAARLLSSEDVCVETDFGLTDEGEPWLVLCDAESGDIFGHFAKIHEEYIACVPFCRCALMDRELPGLLSRFLQRRGIAWSTVTGPMVHSVTKLAAFGFILLHCA